jgi:hypothetical protein
MKLHTYKAVIMSHERLVKAPSALAAAVFFGKHAHKSAKYGALIYEKDGKPYTKKCFWIKWQLNIEKPSKEHLDQIEKELPFCEFVDEGVNILGKVPESIAP